MNTDKIPQTLKDKKRWLCWSGGARDGKETKIPYTPGTTSLGSSTNPKTWREFSTAIADVEKGRRDGIGYVLGDGVVGVELDNVRNPSTGELTPQAKAIITALNSYTEISPSRRGIHILCWSSETLPGRAIDPAGSGVYSEARYFTMTGNHLEGTPLTIEDRTAEFQALYEQTTGTAPPTTLHSPADELSAEERAMWQSRLVHKSDGTTDRSASLFAFGGYLKRDGHPPSIVASKLKQLDHALGLHKYAARHDDREYTRIVDKHFALQGAFRRDDAAARANQPTGPTTEEGAPDENAAATSPPAATTTDGELPMVSVARLMAEPKEKIPWLVEGRLPAGGFSLLAGRPKAGKSTLVRCLAIAVARGNPWLGFSTRQGAVFYLAFEEKRDEVRSHFMALGTQPEDPIEIFFGPSPQDGFTRLQRTAERKLPALIIVDPLLKLVRLKDSNDYAEVSNALEPLLTLARQTGAHLLAVHHLGKIEQPAGGQILGSTAILAAPDTALELRRTEKYRVLSSLQRYGTDLEEVTLLFNPTSRLVTLGYSRQGADERSAAQEILDYLVAQGAPLEERAIREAVEGRKAAQIKALRRLVAEGKVVRTGEGRKRDPYQYTARENAGSAIPLEKREPQNQPLSLSLEIVGLGPGDDPYKNTGSQNMCIGGNNSPKDLPGLGTLILRLGQNLDWPMIQYQPGVFIRAGEENWRLFVAGHGDAELRLALGAIELLCVERDEEGQK